MSDDISLLNQYCQKNRVSSPSYDYEYCGDGFSCTITIDEETYRSLSTHANKKEAKKDAARVAVRALLPTSSIVSNVDTVTSSVEALTISDSLKSLPTTAAAPLPNGHSPLTSATIGGRVIDNVYYSANATSVAPPPGFPAGPLRSPSHTPPHTSTPPASRVPLSINGPSIDHPSTALNKPSAALPVTPPTSETSKPPPLIAPSPLVKDVAPLRSDKDVQDLEFFCTMSRLPSPIYTIFRDKGKHVGRVKIGEMEFGRGWGYESFDEAKDSAAVVAIAGLAMTQLRMVVQQGDLVVRGGPPHFTAAREVHQSPRHTPSPPSSPSAVNQPPPPPHNSHSPHPLTNTHFPRPHLQRLLAPSFTSPPLASQLVPPQVSPRTPPSPFTHPQAPPLQVANLHTPAYFQQPISRGSSQLAQPSGNKAVQDRLEMAVNYKGHLNIYCQKNHYPVPTYECDSPEDAAGYISTVTVNGFKYKSSVHGTKRAADADAAKKAMEVLGVTTEPEVGKSSVKQSSPAVSVTTTPAASNAFISYKNLLQEKSQKEKQSTPHYTTERREEGFVSTVTVYIPSGQSFQETSSPQLVKKAAEQEAAKLACKKLQMI